jgi:Fe-Mn family superoxide dismutase
MGKAGRRDEAGLSPPQESNTMTRPASSAPFVLPVLPWKPAALEPVMSARTIAFHHGKHHAGYIEKLNKLVAGTRYAEMSLEAIVAATAHNDNASGLFNNAAQAWNHGFFWTSLSPSAGAKPSGAVKRGIESAFGDVPAFKKAFATAAIDTFGSGWAWLVSRDGTLEIATTQNAGTPLTDSVSPLLALDVWEHAYYLDYQNDRKKYVEAVIDKLLDWGIAEDRLALAEDRLAQSAA